MAIDGIGSSSASAVAYTQLTAANAAAGKTPVAGPAQGSGGGKLADAISQALAQATDSSTSSTPASAGADATQNPQQAEAAFAQSLFTALQSQASDQAGQAATGATGGHHHHHGGGGGGKIAGGLQSLAQQLSSTGTPADGAASADADLQAKFNALLQANGKSADSASLPQFLQTLSQNLHGASSAGNVVSTKV